jgi:hypothetical protein
MVHNGLAPTFHLAVFKSLFIRAFSYTVHAAAKLDSDNCNFLVVFLAHTRNVIEVSAMQRSKFTSHILCGHFPTQTLPYFPCHSQAFWERRHLQLQPISLVLQLLDSAFGFLEFGLKLLHGR